MHACHSYLYVLTKKTHPQSDRPKKDCLEEIVLSDKATSFSLEEFFFVMFFMLPII